MVPQKVKYFFETTVQRSTDYFDVHPLFITTKRAYKGRKLNTFLSPLLYSYNNLSINLPVMVSGYPYIQMVDNIARRISPKDMSTLVDRGKYDNNMIESFDKFINISRERLLAESTEYNYELLFDVAKYYNNIIAFVQSRDVELIVARFHEQRTGNEPSIEEIVKKKAGNPERLSFTNYIKNIIAVDAVYDKYLYDFFWPNDVFPYIVDEAFAGADYGKLFTDMLVNHFKHNFGRHIVDMEKEIDDVKNFEKMFNINN